MQVIIDFQERDESDIGDKIFNLKKLGLIFFMWRDNFDTLDGFIKRNSEKKNAKVVQEAIFLLDSVFQSFGEIKETISEGININQTSKTKIEKILNSGQVQFGKSPKTEGGFDFKISWNNNDYVNSHEFEDYFSLSKIKINQKADAAPCFREFFQIFTRVSQFAGILKSMVREGLEPEDSLLAPLNLKYGLSQIEDRINTANQNIDDWKFELDKLFKSCDKVERFFLLMFRGNNLTTLNRTNLKHFLRFCSGNIKLELIEESLMKEHFKDSRNKLDFLKNLLRKNKKQIQDNIMVRTSKLLLNKNKLNFIKIQDLNSNLHKYLVYLFEERFK